MHDSSKLDVTHMEPKTYLFQKWCAKTVKWIAGCFCCFIKNLPHSWLDFFQVFLVIFIYLAPMVVNYHDNTPFHFVFSFRRMIGQNYSVNLKASTVLTAYGGTSTRRTSIPNIGATRSALPSAQFHSPSSGVSTSPAQLSHTSGILHLASKPTWFSWILLARYWLSASSLSVTQYLNHVLWSSPNGVLAAVEGVKFDSMQCHFFKHMAISKCAYDAWETIGTFAGDWLLRLWPLNPGINAQLSIIADRQSSTSKTSFEVFSLFF